MKEIVAISFHFIKRDNSLHSSPQAVHATLVVSFLGLKWLFFKHQLAVPEIKGVENYVGESPQMKSSLIFFFLYISRFCFGCHIRP